MPSQATVATAPQKPQVLLSRKQAAAALAMSLSHFERHVQASLPCVRSGQLMLYPLKDLEDWAERCATTQQVMPSTRRKGRERGPDKRTRWPSVVIRHRVGCPAHRGKRCRCTPGYVARVWDPARRRPVSSPTFRTPTECFVWQMNTRAELKSGRSTSVRGIKVNEACDRFIDAIKDGVALNKRGKPYKKSATRTIENALRGRIEREFGSLQLGEVRRGHIQRLVDDMVAESLSGSRVRNVLNALRSLYRYAIARELVQSSPITNVLLPSVGEIPRNRVATPVEFRERLLALEPADAVPFALAGYATARSQEILNLTWAEVDWTARMIYLADEEEYAKSDSARRPFPLIPQLRQLLRSEWQRQGRPAGRQLVCPGRKPRVPKAGSSARAPSTLAQTRHGTPRNSHTSDCTSLDTQLRAGYEQRASTSRHEACSWGTQALPAPTGDPARSPMTATHIYSQVKSRGQASDSRRT